MIQGQRGLQAYRPVHDALERVGINYNDDIWVLPSSVDGFADSTIKLDWRKWSRPLEGHDALNQHYQDLLRKVAAGLVGGLGRQYASITIKSKLYFYRKLFCELQAQGFAVIMTADSVTIVKVFELWIGRSALLRKDTVGQWISDTNLLYRMKEFTKHCFIGRPISNKEVQRLTARLIHTGYWEAPPEQASIYLLRASIDFLSNHADRIISFFYRYVAAVEDALSCGIKTKRPVADYVASKVLKIHYEELIGSIEMCTDWKSEPASVARLVNHISAACFIVITFTSGQRVSELRRANSTSLVSRRHENGSEHYYYTAPRSKIRFLNSNHSSEGTGHSDVPWILSPAAVDAFDILVKLSKPARVKSQIDNLWLTNYGSALWPFNPKKGFIILGAPSINARLNNFAEFVKLADATGWAGRLHSHMGRKHLARFVAKRDRTLLGDLARQYSHLSAESVDVSYASPDSEFRRMMQEELASEMTELSTILLESPAETIFTNGKNDRVVKFLGELRSTRDVKSLLAVGTRLFPCQWGVCFYAQETSACDGSRSAPNSEKRTPPVCVGCANFAATPRHLQWWSEFEIDCKRIIKQNKIGHQTQLVLEERLRMARSILTKIAE